jgi:5S rRNA maturation endonuclease (ribonuclease M5)
LPQIIAAQTVVITEGEKDCENLAKLGFVATTNPLGAGKWRDHYSDTLRGKDVIVFGDVGDDDGAGEKHVTQVIHSLSGKAKSIKRVTLPDGFHDVSDYIASLPCETTAQAIAKLIDEAPAAVELPPAPCRPLRVEPPGLETLLDDICAFVRQYISFTSEAQPTVIALWIVHTWFVDTFEFTPYLHIFSPTRQCGKSHLLDCIAKLVRNVLSTVSLTVAALFRTIEQDQPTLLIDEVDTVFGKGNENEELRAILNAGFERGSKVRRCIGPNHDLKDFAVFCPKALAGIGQLPDTVSDRCIPIHLIAKKKSEAVQRFRKREVNVERLAAALEAYSQKPEIIEALRNGRAEVPEISDRQNDIAEGLIVIADIAGGDWPGKARKSLIEIFSAKEEDNVGVQLLASCRVAFGEGQDRITTKELLDKLIEEETGTLWAHWWENDLNKTPPNIRGPAARIARLLKPFGIKARVIKMPDDSTSRGYLREDFEDNWSRFCPVAPEKDVTM